MRSIRQCAEQLDRGVITSRALVEECLERIADPSGEGSRAFISVDAEAARRSADAHDLLRRCGRMPSPFAGIPFAVKDLFDVVGQVTTAGSRVLVDLPPAPVSAPTIRRMLEAGFIPIGRTNMTEFAYSGIGANPHYGTPLCPWDRKSKRLPGGSSSGSAVAVADGMAVAALGSDTGGSCRVPAALCGIVGFKPTAARIPRDGIIPLSSLDSIGPLAASVSCCAVIDGILAGNVGDAATPRPISGLRLALPKQIVSDNLDAAVSAAFDSALSRLSKAGATISIADFPPLSQIGDAVKQGGFAATEAYAWHRDLLATKKELYDPRVGSRIATGASILATDYLRLIARRKKIIEAMNALTMPFDALVMPTCPIIAPRLDEIAADADYFRLNSLLLRNTNIANFLDRCAISLPCHKPGQAPVGLMLVGETNDDEALLSIATGVEALLAARSE